MIANPEAPMMIKISVGQVIFRQSAYYDTAADQLKARDEMVV